MIAHRRRVVFADDAFGGPLDIDRRRPRLEDVFGRETFQCRQIVPKKQTKKKQANMVFDKFFSAVQQDYEIKIKF